MNNTTAHIKILESQSLYLMSVVNEYLSQLMIILGVVGLYFACSVMLTIFSTKSLRERNFLLLTGVSFGEAAYGIYYIFLGSRNLIFFKNKQPLIWNQVECLLEDYVRVSSTPLIQGFFLCCGIDRLLAMTKPHWYNVRYPRWLCPLMVFICILLAVLEPVYLLSGSRYDIMIPHCSFLRATSAECLNGMAIRFYVYMTLNASVYIAMIVTLFIKLSKVKKQNGNVSDMRKELQLKMIFSLTVMISFYLVTVGGAGSVTKLVVNMPVEYQLRIGLIGSLFHLMSPLCNFLMLMWKNNEFRRAYLNLFKCFKITRVSPGSN